MRSVQYLIIGLALVPAILGCGADPHLEDRPATVSVKGTVTYDGDPVEGASVTFHAQSESTPGMPPQGESAFGRTDSSGRFELTTFQTGDGAVPGEYDVTITKIEAPPQQEVFPEDDPRYDPDAGTGEETPARNLLPEKYSNPRSSDLRATVSADGPNEFAFDLATD